MHLHGLAVDGARRSRLPRLPRLPRRTVRLRLTVLYGGLFLLSGAGLLAITYLLVSNRLPKGAVFLSRSGGSGTTAPNQLSQACAPLATGLGLAPPLPSATCESLMQSQAAQQRAQELNQLLTESGIALAIMAVISIALGWLMAGRVLRPLRTITAAAQRISASNLHRRLALAGPDDELKELGDTFDRLLGRLAASFDAQRQFVANASHELRTPLTRQRTLLEVALGDPGATVDSLRGTCQRVLATGAEQETLIEALLTLARGERGLDRQELLDLRAVAGDVLLARHQEAQRRGLRIDAALDQAAALGDPRLTERLLGNLIDNALRHNAANGWIKVTTGTRAGRAVLAVANSGPVIPHAEVGQLFQPFHRRGGERTGGRGGERTGGRGGCSGGGAGGVRGGCSGGSAGGVRGGGVRGGVGFDVGVGGVGLGLAIVHAIATAHDATVTARAQPAGGLEVEVRFPAPGPPDRHVPPPAAAPAMPRRARAGAAR
jgi:signal transduction histidine kinase